MVADLISSFTDRTLLTYCSCWEIQDDTLSLMGSKCIGVIKEEAEDLFNVVFEDVFEDVFDDVLDDVFDCCFL